MTLAEELRRQLEAAYGAIQEIDEDLAAGRISPADHADLKQQAERHAAALLQRVQAAEHRSSADVGRQSSTRAAVRGSHLKSPLALSLAGVALVVFGVVLGVLISRFAADERPQTAMAPVMPGAPAVSPALAALEKEVEPEAAPTQKLLMFAHQALDEGQIPAAISAYKRVLAREPKNVEAITHVAILLAQGGHVDRALARLDEALAIDPKYTHAHWDRAQILFNERKDYPEAARALEMFLALMPSGADADRARVMLAEARRQASGK